MLKKISLALAVSAAMLLSATFAYADSPVPLSGYAWSSNIGWLSFNSSDGATVSLSTTTTGCSVTSACLSGYAWSSNIGWVKFGGLAGQSVNGITTSDAIVNTQTGAVSGWARACAGTVPGDCSTSVSRTDGWDGWIELAGANHATVTGLTGTATSSAGVSFNSSSDQFSGYAWGSDVVGWVSFNTGSSTNGGSYVCVGSNCNPNPNPVVTPLTASCSAMVDHSSNNYAYVNVSLSPSGGTIPYTYLWSDGSTLQSHIIATTYKESATAYSQPVSVTGVVTDNENPASSTNSISCGSVIIPTATNNSTVTNPELWSGTTKPKGSGTGGSINPSDKFTYTIRPGSSIALDYDWPVGTGNGQFLADGGCNGHISPSPNIDVSTWTSALSLTETNDTQGTTALSGLPIGVYTLQLECQNQTSLRYSSSIMAAIYNFFLADNNPPPITYTNSNPVEIDVVTSTIHEK